MFNDHFYAVISGGGSVPVGACLVLDSDLGVSVAVDTQLLFSLLDKHRVTTFIMRRFGDRPTAPEGDIYSLSGSGKRRPICRTPRARKPQRSVAVLKRSSGAPYTPSSQINIIAKRNESRSGVKHQGTSHIHKNSLVSLLSLDDMSLAKKMQQLGSLKNITECPKCGETLSALQEHHGRLCYRCPSCRGNSGYVSVMAGSIWERSGGGHINLTLQQVVGLVVCFSEGIAATPTAQLRGVQVNTTSGWFKVFREIVAERMVEMQKGFGKQVGKDVIVEADEASVSSGCIDPPVAAGSAPNFSYTRIIALLVRGSRKIIIEKLPERKQQYRL